MTQGDDIARVLTDFAVRIRSGDGLARDSVRICADAIAKAEVRWRSRDTITRQEAAVLIEFFPAVEGASWSYPDAIQEEIYDAAVELNAKLLAAIAADIPGRFAKHVPCIVGR